MKVGIRSAGVAMWIAAGLASFANLTSAQDYVVNKFDLPDDALLWSRWWGSAPQTYEFDYSMDAKGNPSSGSLKASVEFNLASYGGDNQFAVLRNFDTGTTLDGTKFTNLVFELRVDPSSPQNATGNFVYLEYGFRNSDWSQTWLGGQAIPASASAGWIQIAAPINPTLAKLDSVAGVVLKLWSGGTDGLSGTTTFWVDDVALVANKNTTTPPPSMSLAKATPGLQFLVPENSLPNGPGDASVDWNAANVVFIQIGNNADGTATARFMYKINQANGNTMTTSPPIRSTRPSGPSPQRTVPE